LRTDTAQAAMNKIIPAIILCEASDKRFLSASKSIKRKKNDKSANAICMPDDQPSRGPTNTNEYVTGNGKEIIPVRRRNFLILLVPTVMNNKK